MRSRLAVMLYIAVLVGILTIALMLFSGNAAAESHDVIAIDGDVDLLSTASSELWDGTGTEGDPIVISGYEIDAGDRTNGYGIWLKDTTLHVVIANCSVYNVAYFNDPLQGYGIFLDGVSNVNIADCSFGSADCGIGIIGSSSVTVYGCDGLARYMGIFASGTSMLEITNSTIDSNLNYYGVYLNSCSDCHLNDNNLSGSGRGLWVTGSTQIAIDGTTIYEASLYGIYVELSDHVTVGWSYLTGNLGEVAIRLSQSDHVSVHNNTFRDLASSAITTYLCSNASFCNNTIECTEPSYELPGLVLTGSNIVVEDNVISAVSIAISVDGIGGRVTHNTIFDADTAISISNGRGLLVSDNVISGVTYGLSAYLCENVNMSGNSISMAPFGGVGISIMDCTSCMVLENDVSGVASTGLWVTSDQGSTIAGNTLDTVGDRGMYMAQSYDSIVRDNTFLGLLEEGIYIEYGGGIRVQNNTACGFTSGLKVWHYGDVTIEGNDVHDSGEWGIYLYTESGGAIASITNNDCRGCGSSGILVSGGNNAVIEGNDCSQCYIGIQVSECMISFIGNNTCDGCFEHALSIFASGGSTVLGGSYSDSQAGITMYTSQSSVVYGVNASGNNLYGILLVHSGFSSLINCTFSNNEVGIDAGYLLGQDCSPNSLTISGCSIENNTLYGAYFHGGTFTSVRDNHFAWNADYAVYLMGTDNFWIYNNTFLNNRGLEGIIEGSQAYDEGTYNRWYELGSQGGWGNGWSNLKNIDRDNDGIVDADYRIAAPYQHDFVEDSYPLPYGPKIEATSPPTEVTAEVAGWYIAINFTAPTDLGNSSIAYYRILRGENPDPLSMEQVGEVWNAPLSFLDQYYIQNGRTYYYAVTAVNADEFESEPSALAEVIYQPFPVDVDDVIIIGSDEEFELVADQRDWSGDGTAGNPYIIQGLVIDGQWHQYCIYIHDTTAHFVILDCTLFFGMRTEGSGTGIFLENVLNARVEGCTIMAWLDFAMIVSSSQVSILDCHFYGTNTFGVSVISSDGFSLVGSQFDTMYNGLSITDCTGFLVSENIFAGVDTAITAMECSDGVISWNTASDGLTFVEMGGGSQGCSIEWNQVVNYDVGIQCYLGHDMIVRHNNITGDGGSMGIGLSGDLSTIEDNSVAGMTYGILLMGNDNIVANNSLMNNQYGLWCGSAFGGLGSCSGCLIKWNDIYDNEIGIYLAGGAEANEVFNNRIHDNSEFGIYAAPGSSNTIYANLFQGNALNDGTFSEEHIQVFDGSGQNIWSKNGLGNYWAEWTLPDNDGDGIVDLAYVIDPSVQDEFPLSTLFGPPMGLRTVIGPDFVHLTWEEVAYDFQGGIDGYVIYRGTTPGALEEIARTSSRNYNDTTVTLGTTYYYRVAAYKGAVIGPQSDEVSARPANLPGVPTGLVVERGIGSITLTWTTPLDDGGSEVLGFTVWKGTSTSELVYYATVWGTTFADVGLADGESNYYAVKAFNLVGNGTMSSSVRGDAFDVPSAPRDVLAQFSDGAVNLSWSAPLSDGGLPILNYNIKVLAGLDQLRDFDVDASSRWTVISGLTNGVNYTFIVVAYNEVGEGALPVSVWAVPARVTGPVLDLTAMPGSDSVTLNWSPPADTGGDAPGLYWIYRGTAPDAMSFLVEAQATEHIDGTAVNGVVYYYSVVAVNKAGAGPACAAVVTVPGMPTPPADLTAEAVDGQVVLEWSAGSANGGDLIAYKVYRGTAPGSLAYLGTVDPSVTQYDDGQVDPGTTYYYRVSAVTDRGEGELSNEASASAPVGVPGAPRALAVDTSAGQAALTWQAPLFSSPVTDYLVYRGTMPGDWLYIGHTGSGSVLSFADIGYDGLTAFYYVVRASNSYGISVASNEVSTSEYVPPVPSAPQALIAGGDSSSVLLSWIAPATGGPILEYRIFRAVGPGVEILAGTVTTLYFLDTGLTNGVACHYTVSAVNAHGEGAAASASATPKGVPDAPQVEAVAGNGHINLTWQEPADQGDLIVGYIIYRGLTPGGMVFLAQTADLYYNNTGLGQGTTYYYEVRAVNGVGLGELSVAVSSTTLAPPAQASSASATGGVGSVVLEWTAPLMDGGRPVLGYHLYQGSDVDPFNTVTELTLIVSDLTAGTTYAFRIVPFNEVGEGPSVEVMTTTMSPPGPISDLYATAGNGQVTLRWSAPAGGAAGYVIYRGTTAEAYTTSFEVSVTFLADDGLENGVAYYYAIAAVNAAGEGPWSEIAIAPGTVPSAPLALVATAGTGNISLSWTLPSSTGGSTITSYLIYRSTTEAGPMVFLGTSASPNYADDGVLAGMTYYYRVSALNAYGEGDRSAQASALVAASAAQVPGTVERINTTAQPGSVLVAWAAPSSQGGSAITGYRVYRGTSASEPVLIGTVPGTATSFSDVGVVADQTYYYWVVAENSAGAGPMPASAITGAAGVQGISPVTAAPSDNTVLYAVIGVLVAVQLATVVMVLRKRR